MMSRVSERAVVAVAVAVAVAVVAKCHCITLSDVCLMSE